MMRKKFYLKSSAVIILFFISQNNLFGQESSQNFITSDIDNFWNAYDKITATKDRAEQLEQINKLFIEKGSPGLKGIMQARDYTDQSYIDAINNYPLFWNSVRANTLKAKELAKNIEVEVNKLKTIYPELKPAKIYFTIGALKTGGTTQDGMVLIGSEVALADKNTVTREFPKELRHLRSFFDGNSINDVVFTNVHEYVHTQQKTTAANNLLGQSVLEGVAEFVKVKATNNLSTLPAYDFGKQHLEKIREKFSTQMFNPFTGFWLYSNAENEFENVRDLGYSVGYNICEKYYEKAADKKLAIKEMIELDYNNEAALENFAQESGYFATSIEKLEKRFEKNRPTVVAIKEFKNGAKNINPNLTQITIEFSDKMDQRFRNFELGPLGKDNLLRIKKFISFSEDGKAAAFEIELSPNRQYQIVVGERFRSENDISLKPYLINFKTARK